MKVIIQNQDTHLYATEAGQWTAHASEAKDFTFSIHASAVARSLGLKNFNVLFYFSEFDYKVIVGGSRSNLGESIIAA